MTRTDDGDGRHVFQVLGYLGDDDRPPLYRTGRTWTERHWADGRWTGPQPPLDPPDFVRAACSCHWASAALYERADPGIVDDLETRTRQEWELHRTQATDTTVPAAADRLADALVAELDVLAVVRPLAALALIRQLHAAADELAPYAAREAHFEHTATWDAIGDALGTPRQNAHRWYAKKTPPPITRTLAARVATGRQDGHGRLPAEITRTDGRPLNDITPADHTLNTPPHPDH
ncbi:hypothetical protein [Streptomyces luteireticuli]|uniref:Uncharacterized protein n=1 Tax=Streptomyces luteireticuli TaxID=173858 RepID=A0ABN0Z8W6_9ACTN